MFSHHRGTETLPIEVVEGNLNPLWWAAQHDNGRDVIYVKVGFRTRRPTLLNKADNEQLVNAANSAVPLTLEFDREISGVNGTILTHEIRNGFNYLNNQTAISPKALEFESTDGSSWDFDVPKASVIVLEFS